MSQNRRSKILIVDDVPESALITKSLLAKGNFTDVEIACGGYEALEKCGVTVDGQGEAEGEPREGRLHGTSPGAAPAMTRMPSSAPFGRVQALSSCAMTSSEASKFVVTRCTS